MHVLTLLCTPSPSYDFRFFRFGNVITNFTGATLHPRREPRQATPALLDGLQRQTALNAAIIAAGRTFIPSIASELTATCSTARSMYDAVRTGGSTMTDVWTFTVTSRSFTSESFRVTISPAFLAGEDTTVGDVARGFQDLCSCGFPSIYCRPCVHLACVILTVSGTVLGSNLMMWHFVDERFLRAKWILAYSTSGSMTVPALSLFDSSEPLVPGSWLASNIQDAKSKVKARLQRLEDGRLGIPPAVAGSRALQFSSLGKRRERSRRRVGRGRGMGFDEVAANKVRNAVIRNRSSGTAGVTAPRGRRCGICQIAGHDKRTCPLKPKVISNDVSDATTSESDAAEEANRIETTV